MRSRYLVFTRHHIEKCKTETDKMTGLKRQCGSGATRKVAEMLKFPRKEKEKEGKKMEGKGKEEEERRRERIRDRMGQYIGKEEGIVLEVKKVLSLLAGRKKCY